jgi:DNA invertase Pin-like site-specific DNA recombinase
MTTMSKPRRAVIYARISDARNGDSHGVDGQAKAARALAASLGWHLGPEETHLVIENDTSAFRTRKIRVPGQAWPVRRTVRPGFRAMLDMLWSGEADGLVALDADRMARQPADAEDLISVITADNRTVRTPVAFVNGGQLVTADDVAMFRIRVTMAVKASEDTARRVAAARKHRAEAGYWGGGGVRPYGFTHDPDAPDGMKTLVQVPAEAAEIRNMASQVLSGVSLRQVAADLRARDVPTVRRGPWASNSVRGILTNYAVAGIAVHDGHEHNAAWEPILAREQWRAVRTLLNDPGRRTDKGNTPKWLLSTLAVCGKCGATVQISGGGHQSRARGPGAARPSVYVCSASPHLRRTAHCVDEWVTEVIISRLSQPDAIGLLPGREPEPDRRKLETDLAKLRRKSDRNADLWADDKISDSEMQRISASVNRSIRAIEQQLARAVIRSPLESLPVGTDAVAGRWAQLPLGTKREIIKVLMTVTLAERTRRGGRGFDVDSVDIEWRQSP